MLTEMEHMTLGMMLTGVPTSKKESKSCEQEKHKVLFYLFMPLLYLFFLHVL
jgi:hypothetical protein